MGCLHYEICNTFIMTIKSLQLQLTLVTSLVASAMQDLRSVTWGSVLLRQVCSGMSDFWLLPLRKIFVGSVSCLYYVKYLLKLYLTQLLLFYNAILIASVDRLCYRILIALVSRFSYRILVTLLGHFRYKILITLVNCLRYKILIVFAL